VQVIVKIRKKMDLPTTLDVHLSERPEVLSEDCMKSDLRRHCSKNQIVKVDFIRKECKAYTEAGR
jgi:hypothetical protein